MIPWSHLSQLILIWWLFKRCMIIVSTLSFIWRNSIQPLTWLLLQSIRHLTVTITLAIVVVFYPVHLKLWVPMQRTQTKIIQVQKGIDVGISQLAKFAINSDTLHCSVIIILIMLIKWTNQLRIKPLWLPTVDLMIKLGTLTQLQLITSLLSCLI